MSNRREYIYRGFERFWHWAQALLIVMLGVTGFEIHGSIHFFGFRQAVELHNLLAITFLGLIVFAIFWHLTTGDWKHYIPTLENLRAYIDYYIVGIFHGAPHPTRKHDLSKLNPLQKLVYAGFKVLGFPVMMFTGLLYMFYRYPHRYEVISLNLDNLNIIAALHTFGAYGLAAFLIAHIYLITTGTTVTSHLKAMITGYEEIHDTPEAEEKPHIQIRIFK
ncbi:cytochrome b/b6 domain-containing protein [bacterium]|nr:MAG: cytochrome b/b6 domain-containing protein [bacterium]